MCHSSSQVVNALSGAGDFPILEAAILEGANRDAGLRFPFASLDAFRQRLCFSNYRKEIACRAPAHTERCAGKI
jgi:hypothetical protein